MVHADDFDRTVALPPGLTIPAIRATIDYVERRSSELIEVYYEQANIFSAIVGVFATKGLDTNSVYEKSRHIDTAQQRFPDLRRRGSAIPTPPNECLETKASKRPWEIQSHYDHAGWYIIFRYLVDPTESFEPGHPVIVWRVDVVFLLKEDWKYEGSTAASEGGGRTHTFGVRKAATRLRGCAVYMRRGIVLRDRKPVLANGH